MRLLRRSIRPALGAALLRDWPELEEPVASLFFLVAPFGIRRYGGPAGDVRLSACGQEKHGASERFSCEKSRSDAPILLKAGLVCPRPLPALEGRFLAMGHGAAPNRRHRRVRTINLAASVWQLLKESSSTFLSSIRRMTWARSVRHLKG